MPEPFAFLGGEVFVCDECYCSFDWAFLRDHHVQRHHKTVYAAELFHAIVEPEQFPCDRCDYKSYYQFELHRHQLHEHDHSSSQKRPPSPEESEKYQCDRCEYTTDSGLLIANHTCRKVPAAVPTNRNFLGSLLLPSPALAQNLFGSSSQSNDRDDLLEMLDLKDTKVDNEIIWLYCDQCSYKTEHASWFRNHMLDHAQSKRAQIKQSPKGTVWLHCAECSYRTKLETRFKMHMRKHAIKRAKCEGKFKHAKSHYVFNWLNCEKCSYRTKYPGTLRNHASVHASECDTQVGEKRDEIHLRKNAMKRAKFEDKLHHTKNRIVYNWLYCEKCSYKSKYAWRLSKHMSIHTSEHDTKVEEKHDSQVVEKHNTQTKDKHATQVEDKHDTQVETALSKEFVWMHCKECSYRTKLGARFKIHKKKHAIERARLEGRWKRAKNRGTFNWLYCEHCPYKVKYAAHLKNHSLIHASKHDTQVEKHDTQVEKHDTQVKNALPKEIVELHCEECSYSTKFKANFKIHMKKHAMERTKFEDKLHHSKNRIVYNWLYCERCDYKTKYAGRLRKHALIHASKHVKVEEKHDTQLEEGQDTQVKETLPKAIVRLHCEECSYSTKLKIRFRVHMKKHAMERAKFGDRSRRIKNRVIFNWLYCDRCSFKTKYAGRLRNHASIHASDHDSQVVEASAKETVDISQPAKNHHIHDWLYCERCSYKSKYAWRLRKHASIHASEHDTQVEDKHDMQVEDNHDTQVKETHDKVHMRRHAMKRAKFEDKLHHVKNRIVYNWLYCEKCSYKSKNAWRVKKHMLIHASEHDTKVEEKRDIQVEEHNTQVEDRHNDKVEEKHEAQVKEILSEEMVILHCEECSYNTKLKSRFKIHMKKHAMERAKFGDRSRHIKNRVIFNWLYCDRCSFKTKYAGHLRNHASIHASDHDSQVKEAPSNEIVDTLQPAENHHIYDWLYCERCSYKSKYAWRLKKHMWIHASKHDTQVEEKHEVHMRRHGMKGAKFEDKLHHAKNRIVDNWLYCEKCSYKSKYAWRVKKHMSIHASKPDTHVEEQDDTQVEEQDATQVEETSPKKIGKLYCKECSYSTNLRIRFNVHVRKHVMEKARRARYKNKFQRVQHDVLQRPKHNGIFNWLYCERCSYKTKYAGRLRNHASVHSANHDAQVEETPAKDIAERLQPTKSHHIFTWLYCEKCSFRTKYAGRLRNHASIHAANHDAQVEVTPPKEIAERLQPTKSHHIFNWLYCEKCSFRTKYAGHLRNHASIHSANHDVQVEETPAKDIAERLQPTKSHHIFTWLYCEKCSFRTKYAGRLRNHASIHASEHDVQDGETRPKGIVDTLQRAKNHHIFNWLYCEKCSYRTKYPGSLKNHASIHASEHDPNVEVEKKHDKVDMRKHAMKRAKFENRFHRTENRIVYHWLYCERCSYKSKYAWRLRKHAAIHASEHDPNVEENRDAQVEEKHDKVDMRKHGLKRAKFQDKLQHAKNRIVYNWLYCERCSYKSKYAWRLRKHASIHDSEHDAKTEETEPKETIRLYCEECSYNTEIIDSFKIHMKKHAMERARLHDDVGRDKTDGDDFLCCEKCSYRTKHQGWFETHMRKQHPEKEETRLFNIAEDDLSVLLSKRV